jgi:hypothetical protein
LQERDIALRERNEIMHDRDRIKCERDALELERDKLLRDKERLEKELINRSNVIDHLKEHLVSIAKYQYYQALDSLYPV